MELKVPCNCGQNFKFDVEPLNGQMPFNVSCPACGADGTATANLILTQSPVPPPLSVATPPVSRLQINQSPQTTASAAPRPAIPTIQSIAPPSAKATGQFSLGLGVVGALAGAAIGTGLMFGFYEWAGFRFPLLGVGIGVLTGYGARLLAKGSDQTLAIIAAVIALGSVVGALFLMYGEFPTVNIISVVISASVAYRIANR